MPIISALWTWSQEDPTSLRSAWSTLWILHQSRIYSKTLTKWQPEESLERWFNSWERWLSFQRTQVQISALHSLRSYELKLRVSFDISLEFHFSVSSILVLFLVYLKPLLKVDFLGGRHGALCLWYQQFGRREDCLRLACLTYKTPYF